MDTEIEKTMGILTDLLHARAYDENYPTDSDLKEAIKELREFVARVKAKDDEIARLKIGIEFLKEENKEHKNFRYQSL